VDPLLGGAIAVAVAVAVAEVGLVARERERFSRGRPEEAVFLDEGAMMARPVHGWLLLT